MSSSTLPASGARRTAWFSDRPVAVKIAVSVIVVAVVAIVVGVTALQSMTAIGKNADDIYTNSLMPLADLGNIQFHQSENKVDIAQYILAPDNPSRRAGKLEDSKADDAAIDASLASYVRVASTSPAAQKQIAALKTSLTAYRTVRDTQEVPIALSQGLAKYHKVHSAAADASDAVDAATVALLTLEKKEAADALSTARATQSSSRTQLIVLLVVGLLAGLGLSLLVSRMITGSIGKVRASLQGLAAGDLTIASGVSSKDEVGQMAAALESAQESLREVLSGVVASADAVAAS
ncbi:MAG: hypothetical protein QOJ68_949, partial [Blastococcus sp.]|nr:hypothetical protein [Blastococcus sp.]